jgi:surface protein
MKKFKVFALVFAIMLSATGLGLLFGSNQPASTQAKVSADETTTLAPGIYTVDSSGKVADTPTKSWDVIATKASDNSLTVSLEEGDGTYLVCGKLPEGVTSLYEAFSLGESLTDIVFTDSFDTSKVTDMSYMFGDCSVLTSITFSPSFDTSKVTDMSFMFSGCSALTSLDLSKFNTSNVTNMDSMFYDCRLLTSINLSNFNTGKVISMCEMFRGDTDNGNKLVEIVFPKSFGGAAQDLTGMFNNCTSLISLDLSNFDTGNVTDMREMFSNCSSLKSITFGAKFDTSNVTNMDSMFSDCSKLTSLDLSKFNTGNVMFMGAMFSNCNLLNKLNLSSFNTSNVNDMNHMFSSCSSLTSLDLGKFDTQNVTLMTGMFSNCNLLTSLDLTNFNTTNCVRMGGNYIPDDGMFYNCSSLISLKLGDKFITNNTKIMLAMFANCSKLTDLDLGGFEISNGTNIHLLFSGCTSLQNIKMPNIMNADSTIKLSDLSLPNDKSWYSLASGDSKGTLVADTNVSANTYAGHILTINQNKSYAEIDKIIANATKPSTPETPSTGVVLDVVLPVASIVLVLASLCAVAFVGKKKKQF